MRGAGASLKGTLMAFPGTDIVNVSFDPKNHKTEIQIKDAEDDEPVSEDY
jgi:hypothetical protein